MKKVLKFCGLGFTAIMVLFIAITLISGASSSTEKDEEIQANGQANAAATEIPKPTKVAEESEPTSTPKAKKSRKQIKAEYSPLEDVRELVARTGKMKGDKVVVTGEVVSIFDTGSKTVLGDSNPKEYSAQIQIGVYAPDGSAEALIVGFNGDTSGIYQGSVVTVWGKVMGTATFVGVSGGEFTQPLLAAKYVEADKENDDQNSTGGPVSDDGFMSLEDIRELSSRTGKMIGQKVAIQGEVFAIFDTGESAFLGDNEPQEFSATIQIFVAAPDGSVQGIVVGYNGDTTGIYKGSVITVFGTVVDTASFIGTEGGYITQPLIDAERLRVDQ